MSQYKKLPEIEETHMVGSLSVEKNFKSEMNVDVGIQIAPDGRIWICVEGQAFIRFKPNVKRK